jgi:hypothetical protein
MSTLPTRPPRTAPLVEGEKLTQEEFHRRYAAYPEDVKFELIGGIVYMTSPLRWPHGVYHSQLNLALGLYQAGTPGIELGDNATTILGAKSEPQPDLALRILPECGGQSQINPEKYVEGAPELLAEIADSSRAVDLHQKKTDYEEAGVIEYLVLSLEEEQLHWFDLASQRPLKPNRQGIFRSSVFPGLWIDSRALLARNSARLIQIVQQGLASSPHATFVKRLEARRRKKAPG